MKKSVFFGAFAATGKHQEEHDGDEDGTTDHWLDGDSTFWGGDVVYKYNAPKPHGQGDVIVQVGQSRVNTAEAASGAIDRYGARGPVYVVFERNRQYLQTSFSLR